MVRAARRGTGGFILTGTKPEPEHATASRAARPAGAGLRRMIGALDVFPQRRLRQPRAGGLARRHDARGRDVKDELRVFMGVNSVGNRKPADSRHHFRRRRQCRRVVVRRRRPPLLRGCDAQILRQWHYGRRRVPAPPAFLLLMEGPHFMTFKPHRIAALMAAVPLFAALPVTTVAAPAPAGQAADVIQARTEGIGPFKRVVLRNVLMVDGTGAPAQGPYERCDRERPHRADQDRSARRARSIRRARRAGRP